MARKLTIRQVIEMPDDNIKQFNNNERVSLRRFIMGQLDAMGKVIDQLTDSDADMQESISLIKRDREKLKAKRNLIDSLKQ
jgi:hypothetical protein